MLHRKLALSLIALMMLVATGNSISQAALVTDYFDYGGTTSDLHALGTATDGWTGAWTRRDTSASLLGPNYTAGARLVFSNPDYNNDLNPVGSGGVQTDSGNAVHPSERTLVGTGEGEVWISLLARLSDVTAGFNSRASVWLNPGASIGGTSIAARFAMEDEEAFVQIGTYADRVLATPTLNNNEIYLWLARLDINSAGNDTLDFWIKSSTDDISSAAALGSPLATVSAASYFGTAGLNEVGFAFQSDISTFDALRISNEPNAYQQVILGFTPILPVPEPGSIYGLALGSLLLIKLRRRANGKRPV